MPEFIITAVCDVKDDRLEWAKEQLPDVKTFKDASLLMDSGEVDAILIATPHYFHPPMVIEGLNKGLHVMSEKPAGVYTKQVKEMNAVADESKGLFTMMFNQRTNCVYRKMREIVQNGGIGEVISGGGAGDPMAISSNGHRVQIEALAEAILAGKKKIDLDGREGRRAVALITSIYKSAQTGKPVKVD